MEDHRRVEGLVEQYAAGTIGRREFVRRVLALGVAASAIPGLLGGVLSRPAQAQGAGEVVACSWGGKYAAAQKTAFFDPFEKDTGVRVRVVGIPDLAKIQAMVKTGNVEWDFIDAEGQWVINLGRVGMLEPLDMSVVDTKTLVPGTWSRWGVGSVAYSYNLAWSTQVYSKGHEPRTWTDFFDTRRFPGRRAAYKQPIPMLEFALLADGVPRNRLYPLDVPRAFAFLKAHKSAVNIWYSQPSQTAALFRGKEVDMLAGPGISLLRQMKQEGAPVDYTWNQAAWLQSFWVTPKGAPNRDAARKLQAYVARADTCAKFVDLYPGLGVPNAKAYTLMPKDVAASLPTSPQNAAVEVAVSEEWWADNVEPVTKQWIEFIGS
ncbi:MAG TPA: extracellular solute-binding protein [bacterium]|nr:extracellular solute-binding protein [bacterium]